MSVLTHRILLVSDMHYAIQEDKHEYMRKYPGSNPAEAYGNAYQYTQKEKIQRVFSDISKENSRSPLDAVLILGDMSLDDYGTRNLHQNFCEKFKEECLDKLTVPYYVIPGNHDSYPEETWRELFGTGREYVLELCDSVFVMGDTFKGTVHNGPSAPLDTIDETMLTDALEKYKGKKIFICAHHVRDEAFTEKCRKLVSESDDVICMFRGHTHINRILEFCGKKVFDIGGYAYNGKMVNGKYDACIYDFAWAWGYQILEIYDDKVKTYHVKPAMHYEGTNGSFEVSGDTVEDTTEFILNN